MNCCERIKLDWLIYKTVEIRVLKIYEMILFSIKQDLLIDWLFYCGVLYFNAKVSYISVVWYVYYRLKCECDICDIHA